MYKDKPHGLQCGSSHCGTILKVRDLFPDLYNFNKIKPTKENPTLPAEKYLKSRGFSVGLINQLKVDNKFAHWSKVRGMDTGAIMFSLADGNFNGRIYNPPPGEDKGHNKGSVGNLMWTWKLDKDRPLYLTEGVFDALSFYECGFQAWSFLSSSGSPDFSPFKDELRGVRIIIAADNDFAGRKAATNISKQLEAFGYHEKKVEVIAPPKGKDWNDLLLEGKLKDYLDKKKEAQYYGDLLMAEKPMDYARVYYDFNKRPAGIFIHHGATYYTAINKNSDDENDVEHDIISVGKFMIQLVHTEREGDDTDKKFSYRLEATELNGKRRSFWVDSCEMVSAREFKKVCLERRNILYEGSPVHDVFIKWLLRNKDKKVVANMICYGRDELTGAFITPKFCVYKGKSVLIDNGMYKIQKEYYKPFPLKHETIGISERADPVNVYKKITKAYGSNGRVLVAWVLANFFRTEFMEKYNRFPFLSLHGPASCGKSTLARIGSQIRGINFEGHPISKALCTQKGIARTLSQYSDSFVTLIEAENGNESFDTGLVLPLYNGGEVSLKANYTNDNTTDSLKFKSAFMLVQNIEPFKNEQQTSRFISIKFSKRDIENTKNAFDELCNIKLSDFTTLGIHVLKQKEKLLNDFLKEYQNEMNELSKSLSHNRVIETHAFILAAHKVLINQALGLNDSDLSAVILKMAQEKVKDCGRVNNSRIENFLDVLDIIVQNDGILSEPCGDVLALRELNYQGTRCYAVSIQRIAKSRIYGPLIGDTTSLLNDLKRSTVYINKHRVSMTGQTVFCHLIKLSAIEREDSIIEEKAS